MMFMLSEFKFQPPGSHEMYVWTIDDLQLFIIKCDIHE